MKIAFTLCSNNYFSQALVLAKSFAKTNKEYIFHIGIVDDYNPSINYSRNNDFKVTFVQDLSLPNFKQLVEKYNIIELNTCVKASFFQYLFSLYPESTHVHYFDPDMKLFQSLNELDAYFNQNIILLTPHILEPISDDNFEPRENMFLNYGIYNLGYLGLKRDAETFRMLEWWEKHLLNFGYMDVKRGYFVDQLWMNHAPLFFKGVHILREKGYNCAPWNIQERAIIKNTENGIILNDNTLLTFYHFSSYNPNQPEQLSHTYSRNTFESHPEYRQIYDLYGQALIAAGYNEMKTLACSFYPIPVEYEKKSKTKITLSIKKAFQALIPPLFVKIYHFLIR